MIESLGITEEAMGMPIRASMDVREARHRPRIGRERRVDGPPRLRIGRRAGPEPHQAAHLFSGPVQSGLTKMMVVGMGKMPSAHARSTTRPRRR